MPSTPLRRALHHLRRVLLSRHLRRSVSRRLTGVQSQVRLSSSSKNRTRSDGRGSEGGVPRGWRARRETGDCAFARAMACCLSPAFGFAFGFGSLVRTPARLAPCLTLLPGDAVHACMRSLNAERQSAARTVRCACGAVFPCRVAIALTTPRLLRDSHFLFAIGAPPLRPASAGACKPCKLNAAWQESAVKATAACD